MKGEDKQFALAMAGEYRKGVDDAQSKKMQDRNAEI